MKKFFFHLWKFAARAVANFFHDKGLILAGALCYNGLLSSIPLIAVILAALSHVVDQKKLLTIIATELQILVPGHARALTRAAAAFVNQREVIGGVGLVVLLFLSSIAFRILEDAMSVVFHHPLHTNKRSFWVSALLPYLYILCLGLALLLLTTMTSILDTFAGHEIHILHHIWHVPAISGAVLYVAGLVGLALMFTLVYKVVPVAKIQFRRALAGGVTAAFLWEIVRHVLVWYFANISMVNVIYGSLATVIIVLVTLEIAATILILGAEVIAELEMNAAHGLPWHGLALPDEADDDASAKTDETVKEEAPAPAPHAGEEPGAHEEQEA